MVTSAWELLAHVLVSALCLLWVLWTGQVFRLAFGGSRRLAGPGPPDHPLTRSDLQLLRSLNIRP